MELGTYVDELHHQLAAAAAAGSDETRETAQRLTTALDAAARLMLLEALGAATAEISTELAPGSVDLRLRGREPEFVVTQTPRWDEAETSAPAPAAPAAPPAADGEEGATTRTTLRLPDELKARVEAAAARDGVSVNTWLVRAVATTLDGGATRHATVQVNGKRVTGWVR